MPTTNYGLARTVRQEFEKAALNNLVSEISYSKTVSRLSFRATTRSTTANQELFINNKPAIPGVADSAKRLYIGENSGHAFTLEWCAFDTVTKTVVSAGTGFVACSRPNLGNVTLSAGATGTPLATNTVQSNPRLNFSVGDTSLATLSITANTTNQCLQVAVTPLTANQTEWLVQLVPVFNITDRFQSGLFGDSGAGDSLEP
jgi:hypothetical protein